MSAVSPEALRLLALLDELERAGLIGEHSHIVDGYIERVTVLDGVVSFAGQTVLRKQEGEG